MRIVVAVVMLTSVVLPASVFADPSPATDVTKMVTEDCARARNAGKTCVLDVPAEDVDGTTPVPSDVSTRILIFGTQASLIRLRHDFIPEIVKAAEDL